MSRIRSVILTPANLLALSVVFICLALQLAGANNELRFDRLAISSGNWWLLLSGIFVHLGWNHLALNLAGFALVVSLVWINFNAREWLLVILLSSLGVGLGIYFFDPALNYYVGFSGTLHGLIMAGALADIRRYPKGSILLLLMVVAKLGWEQLYGPMPGSESAAGGAVAVNSHLFGAVTGSITGLGLLLKHRLHTPP